MDVAEQWLIDWLIEKLLFSNFAKKLDDSMYRCSQAVIDWLIDWKVAL